MIVVFVLAGMVLVLCRSMGVEAMASANLAASIQASEIERGAEQYIMAAVGQQKGTPPNLQEADCMGIPVGDGYFWILRPDYGDDSMPLFGVTDEAGKLNINTAGYDSLMLLPNMTDDVAASIVDWRDADNTPSPGGAEDDYYSNLKPAGYHCKNSAFETVEELMLVEGVTRELLYGNGQAGPLGVQTGAINNSGTFMTDLWTARGIYDLLTVYSIEPNTAADGSARININDPSSRDRLRDMLAKQLGQTRADAIMQTAGLGTPAPPTGPGRRPGTVLFIDNFDFYFRSKMTVDEFAKVGDSMTTLPSTSKTSSGRVNVNTAPREVLECLPNLDSSDADKLISARDGRDPTDTSIGWVVQALDKKAIGLGNLITGRSYRYSADILAVTGDGRSFKRCRIVIGTMGSTPQIIYRRDLTDRGWPMDPALLASLKAGQGPGMWGNNGGSTMGGSNPGGSSLGGTLR